MSLFHVIKNKINLIIPSEHQINLWKWKKMEKLRYEYKLDEDSIVFDLGGYEGSWTSDIFSMYCSNMYIFEPVKLFYEEIEKRFKKNKNIHVYNYGLSNSNKKIKISLNDNGSSEFGTNTSKEEISLTKAADFFKDNKISKIDLIKINIEGGEYDLLEHLLDSRFIKSIKNVQVQFHEFVPNAKTRMEKIQKKLELTHHLTYSIPFVWENWEINNN